MSEYTGPVKSRKEALLKDIRDNSADTSDWSPKSREEALLMDIRDNGGAGSLPIASVDRLGGVKVDGATIQAASDGTISLAIASGDATEY